MAKKKILAPKFSLPSSKLEQLKKILKGYHVTGGETNRSDLSNRTGIAKDMISRNNKFLTELGLISGGVKKKVTELGANLARALDQNQSADIQRYWREAVESNQSLYDEVLNRVQIEETMTKLDLQNYILYVSGQEKTQHNQTGSKTLMDILIEAKLISEQEDSTLVAKLTQEALEAANLDVADKAHETSTATDEHEDQGRKNIAAKHDQATSPNPLSVAINVQLHLPATEDPEIYRNLFQALRQELLEGKLD